jgi:hypothetical protein
LALVVILAVLVLGEAVIGAGIVAVAAGLGGLVVLTGVGGFALSFLIYNTAISAVNVGWATIVLNLIPAFGLLGSVVFLGEEPTRSGIIGAWLIGGSVIYFTICHRRASKSDLSPAGGLETLIHGGTCPKLRSRPLPPARRPADRLTVWPAARLGGPGRRAGSAGRGRWAGSAGRVGGPQAPARRPAGRMPGAGSRLSPGRVVPGWYDSAAPLR